MFISCLLLIRLTLQSSAQRQPAFPLSTIMSDTTTRPNSPIQSTMTSLPTPWPFDYKDADVVLRTQGVGEDKICEFKIHKLMLRVHSEFFETMFSLPQTPPGSLSKPDSPHLISNFTKKRETVEGDLTQTVLEMSDHCKPLYLILSMCYSIGDPDLEISAVSGGLESTKNAIVVAQQISIRNDREEAAPSPHVSLASNLTP